MTVGGSHTEKKTLTNYSEWMRPADPRCPINYYVCVNPEVKEWIAVRSLGLRFFFKIRRLGMKIINGGGGSRVEEAATRTGCRTWRVIFSSTRLPLDLCVCHLIRWAMHENIYCWGFVCFDNEIYACTSFTLLILHGLPTTYKFSCVYQSKKRSISWCVKWLFIYYTPSSSIYFFKMNLFVF